MSPVRPPTNLTALAGEKVDESSPVKSEVANTCKDRHVKPASLDSAEH